MGMDEGYTMERDNARSNFGQMITHSVPIRIVAPDLGQI
jgi:hypothetical protein